MSGCPSPATAARMMMPPPPPSTGRYLHPPACALASPAPLHTSSTPRPQQRKKRRRAAQQGHVLLTQDSPASESPCRRSLQGEDVLAYQASSVIYCILLQHALPRHAQMFFATSCCRLHHFIVRGPDFDHHILFTAFISEQYAPCESAKHQGTCPFVCIVRCKAA